MFSIKRCGCRFTLENGRGWQLHVTKRELVKIIRTGIEKLAAEKPAKLCKNCRGSP